MNLIQPGTKDLDFKMFITQDVNHNLKIKPWKYPKTQNKAP